MLELSPPIPLWLSGEICAYVKTLRECIYSFKFLCKYSNCQLLDPGIWMPGSFVKLCG